MLSRRNARLLNKSSIHVVQALILLDVFGRLSFRGVSSETGHRTLLRKFEVRV